MLLSGLLCSGNEGFFNHIINSLVYKQAVFFYSGAFCFSVGNCYTTLYIVFLHKFKYFKGKVT